MKKKFKALILAAALLLVIISIPFIVIKLRAPVLIVTEQSFLGLYGEDRVKREAGGAESALLRKVITVSVANDAGDDIVSLAVSDISAQPYCVIFPLRFSRAAKLYREQNPQTRVVLLEGRFPENQRPSAFAIGANTSDYFIYKTDIETDLYRAGFAAAAIISFAVEREKSESGEQNTNANIPLEKRLIAVFQEANITAAANAFKQAVSDFVNGKERKRNEQVTVSIEEVIENKEEEREEMAEVTENGEEGTENWEQVTENWGEVTENTEEGTENGEQVTEDWGEITEGGEIAAELEGQETEGAEFSTWNPSLLAEGREQAAGRKRASSFSTWVFAVSGWLRAVQTEEAAAAEPAEDLIPAPETRFYSSFSQFSENLGLSCVVLVDSGIEYFEKKPKVPIFIFSWMNPILMPDSVSLVIDDSPWSQIVQVVKMVRAGRETGLVPSKFHFLDKNLFNKEILRKIKKSWKNDKIRA